MNYEDLAKTDPHPGPREGAWSGQYRPAFTEQQTAKLPLIYYSCGPHLAQYVVPLAFKLSGKRPSCSVVRWAMGTDICFWVCGNKLR